MGKQNSFIVYIFLMSTNQSLLLNCQLVTHTEANWSDKDNIISYLNNYKVIVISSSPVTLSFRRKLNNKLILRSSSPAVAL